MYIDQSGDQFTCNYNGEINNLSDRSFGLSFIDSCNFLSTSLDSLAKSLVEAKHDFKMLKGQMRNRFKYSDDLIAESCKKGVFPYDYITNASKLEETSLPDIKYFKSILKNDDISERFDEAQLKVDYAQAKKVFDLGKCKTIKDYLNIYLRVDVLLLAEVFHKFRLRMFNDFKLDPACFLTAPSYAISAALFESKEKISLISDPTTLNYFENSIRGGLTSLIQSKLELNDPKTLRHNPEKPISSAVLADVNGLYAKSILENGGLPVGPPETENDPVSNYNPAEINAMASGRRTLKLKTIKVVQIRELMENFQHQLEKMLADESYQLKLLMLLSKSTDAEVSTRRSPPKLRKINVVQIREMMESSNFQLLIKHNLKFEKMLVHDPCQLTFSDII